MPLTGIARQAKAKRRAAARREFSSLLFTASDDSLRKAAVGMALPTERQHVMIAPEGQVHADVLRLEPTTNAISNSQILTSQCPTDFCACLIPEQVST